jgi:hypothetical protein
VGDTVNLDGTPTKVTLVDESRVYHIEGKAPEGVEVGDVAQYFNADTGKRMLVASWSGDEIEFYEGEDAPAELIARAFGFQTTARNLSLSSGKPAGMNSKRTAMIVVVVLFLVIGLAVYFWKSQGRNSSPRISQPARVFVPAPPTKLPIGATGVIGNGTYVINGMATLNIARIRGRQHRHEYYLTRSTGEPYLLVQGLNAAAKEWHLLRLMPQRPAPDPYKLATLRKNAPFEFSAGRAEISELFSAQTLNVEGDAAKFPPAGRMRYGFSGRTGQDVVVARWNETEVQVHAGVAYSEAEVLAAFAKNKAQPVK